MKKYKASRSKFYRNVAKRRQEYDAELNELRSKVQSSNSMAAINTKVATYNKDVSTIDPKSAKTNPEIGSSVLFPFASTSVAYSSHTDEVPVLDELFSSAKTATASTSSFAFNNTREAIPDLSDYAYFSDAEDQAEEDVGLRELLRVWALDYSITQKALKKLIAILNPFVEFKLPIDPRTLVQTPAKIEIVPMGNGTYWHNGLKNCLENYFEDLNETKSIYLNFNIDGLPVYRSSKIQFWPILFSIHGIINFYPMVIGMFCGESKPPSAEEYLRQFVNELKEILTNGLSINGNMIHVHIRCFICDSPARAFVKGTVNFNGYNSCMKCTVMGEFYKDGRHMSFPRIDNPKRTDKSFRDRVDPDHHKTNSPLEDLPMDMVLDVITSDVLHQIHIGVVKKILTGHVTGSYNFNTKWSANTIKMISEYLDNCKMPSEIHRSVRSLNCISFWKALEYRTFLHYIGVVILRDHMHPDAYNNFLMLFCAITICSSKHYVHLLHIAERALEIFIEQYIDIYGIDAIGSNVHGLCHLVDEVKRFGPLDTFSAYPFENALYKIKNLLRHGNNPLSQAAKRLLELSCKVKTYLPTKSYPCFKKCKKSFCDVLQIETEKFYTVEVKDGLILRDQYQNQWFLNESDQIVCMKYAIKYLHQNYIVGCSLKSKESFFETPIRSEYLNIYQSNCEQNEPSLFLIKHIKCKLVAMKYCNKTVFLPLMHTLE